MAIVKAHRIKLFCGFVFLVLWTLINVLLASRFGFVSIDSVMYGLPLARAGHVFDLGIPFLDNFSGLGESWGHQWPGFMWLKACFFLIVPYHVAWDFALLYLSQAAAALLLAGMIWKVTCNIWFAITAVLLVLSDRILLLCGAGQRPESIAILCLALFVFTWFIRGYSWKWLSAFVGVVAVTSHPVVMLLAMVLTFYWFIRSRRKTGSCWKPNDALLLGLGAGLLILGSWLILDPIARQQWWLNIKLQKSFYQNWDGVWTGLSNYRYGGGYILWIVALASGGHYVWRLLRGGLEATRINELHECFLVGWLVFVMVHTLTRCENFSYLAIGNFFAIGVAVLEFRVIKARFATAFLCCLVALHVVILPYRCLQYFRAGMPDYGQNLRKWVEGLPERQSVYFPHVLWPEALKHNNSQWHWWTLPIASAHDSRRSYEKLAYEQLRVGDLLIVDESMMVGVDKFGLQPTFHVVPPDLSKWRMIGEFRSPITGRREWGVLLKAYQCVKAY